MIGGGILALWNDCEAGHEDAYEAWYQGEHLAERLRRPIIAPASIRIWLGDSRPDDGGRK